MTRSDEFIALEETYGAHNYSPLPVVIERGEGVWVWDVEGRKYMDMLSAYSAVSQGHRHPKIIAALKEQADKVTLVSRAFRNDQVGPFLKELCELCGLDLALPMNSGAEGVETAIKAVRKWGYYVKKVQDNRARIIVCDGNFHGRTTTIVGFSSEEQYRRGFGPATPGFDLIPFGDADALERAIGPDTVAFLVEPIQGEAGVIVPPEGYLRKVREICTRYRVLLMLDEVQTGLGRCGRLFACDYEGVKPDVLIVGKALGGGAVPISAVVSTKEVLGVFEPGDHGSTFGGNPLACAVCRAALRVIVEEEMPERAYKLGERFRAGLERMKGGGMVEQVRGKGLLNAVELRSGGKTARQYCEEMLAAGLLCKETHGTVIRFAPPLIITEEQVDWALERIGNALR